MVCGLQSVRALWLWRTVLVVEASGLSCPVACGILVPRPGIEPVSPALEGRFSTTGPPGKSLKGVLVKDDFKILILGDRKNGNLEERLVLERR